MSESNEEKLKEMAKRVAQLHQLKWGDGSSMSLKNVSDFSASVLFEFGFDRLVEINDNIVEINENG